MGCGRSKGASNPSAAPPPAEGVVQHAVAEVLHNIGHAGEQAAESARQAGGQAVGVAKHIGEHPLEAAQQAGEAAKHAGEDAVEVMVHAGEAAVEAAKHAGETVIGTIRREAKGEGVLIHILEKSWYQDLYHQLLAADCTTVCSAATLCRPCLGESNVLGALVKNALEQFDASFIGMETEVGTLVLDPACGRLEVDGLTIFNPEGYMSPYLLRAEKVVVEIDMAVLVASFGKELSVKELIIDGIDVILEKTLHSSNLGVLLHHLENKAENDKQMREAIIGHDMEDKFEEGLQQMKAEHEEDLKQTKVVLHTIVARNIGAKLATSLTHGHGVRVEVGNVRFNDFDKEIGPGRGTVEVIHILFATLIKSVCATIIGKHGTEAIVGGIHKVAEKFAHVGDSALHGLKAVTHRHAK